MNGNGNKSPDKSVFDSVDVGSGARHVSRRIIPKIPVRRPRDKNEGEKKISRRGINVTINETINRTAWRTPTELLDP